MTDGEDSCGIRSRGVGKLANLGGFKSGPTACVFGPNWEAQVRSGLGEDGIKTDQVGAQIFGPDWEPRPIMLKGWVMGCDERPFLIKGSIAGCEGRADMGFESGVGGIKGRRASPQAEVGGLEIRATMEASGGQVKEDGGIACFLEGDWRDSESLMAKARARMTEEALSAEASRYEPVTDDLGGGSGFLFFFYSFWVRSGFGGGEC